VLIVQNFHVLSISFLEEMGSCILETENQSCGNVHFLHKFSFETVNNFFSLFRKAEAMNRRCCSVSVCWRHTFRQAVNNPDEGTCHNCTCVEDKCDCKAAACEPPKDLADR